MANEKRLIDANAIYDAVERRYQVSSGIEHRCERDLLDLICSADTVDAVPVVHGRWLTTIDIDYEGDVVYRHTHMKCGFECKTYGDGYNYCPNCGANMMDGGDEDGSA